MKPLLIKLLLLPAVLMPAIATACITCNQKVQQAIFDSQFYPNLMAMLSPFIVLGLLVAALSTMAARQHKKLYANNKQATAWVPLASAAAVTGIGLGGFIDGIVLHQILQWHQMLSNKIPPVNLEAKTINMFWDGIFHGFTLLVTLVGVILLWNLLHKNGINRSGWVFSGGMLLGWSLFNIIEGLADHHILKLHNVREISPHTEAWNFGFLIFSIVMGLVGWGMIKKGQQHHSDYVNSD